jgi:hypothetical protein
MNLVSFWIEVPQRDRRKIEWDVKSTTLEHDPEKREPVFEKIMLQQNVRAAP